MRLIRYIAFRKFSVYKTATFHIQTVTCKRRGRNQRQLTDLKKEQYNLSNNDWTSIEKVEYKGEIRSRILQTIQFGGIRIRSVEYSNGYLADHWCQKGHIVHCLDGEFITELKNR